MWLVTSNMTWYKYSGRQRSFLWRNITHNSFSQFIWLWMLWIHFLNSHWLRKCKHRKNTRHPLAVCVISLIVTLDQLLREMRVKDVWLILVTLIVLKECYCCIKQYKLLIRNKEVNSHGTCKNVRPTMHLRQFRICQRESMNSGLVEEKDYPELSKLALSLLYLKCSTADIERSFSICKNILSYRYQLGSQMLEASILIRLWLDTFWY